MKTKKYIPLFLIFIIYLQIDVAHTKVLRIIVLQTYLFLFQHFFQTRNKIKIAFPPAIYIPTRTKKNHALPEEPLLGIPYNNYRSMEVAIGRLPKADKELITQWAVTECLSHSTGKMYRYSWVVYALDMVLPRDLTRQSRWDPRPVDLPLESQNMILTTLQLRLWLYFNPFHSRHRGIIFSSHGRLIHFLSAAQVFADACCTDPSCGCGEQESDEEEEDDENAMMEEDDEESSGDEDSSEEAEDESQDESFVPEKASSSVANTP